jgi:hypothetical protein
VLEVLKHPSIKHLKDFNPLDPHVTKVRDAIGRNEAGLPAEADAKARKACITRIAKEIMSARSMATRTVLHRQVPELADEIYTKVQELIEVKKKTDKMTVAEKKAASDGFTLVRKGKKVETKIAKVAEEMEKSTATEISALFKPTAVSTSSQEELKTFL